MRRRGFILVALVALTGYLGGSLGAYIASIERRVEGLESDILLLDSRDIYGPICKLYADMVNVHDPEIIWNATLEEAECHIDRDNEKSIILNEEYMEDWFIDFTKNYNTNRGL